MNLGRNPTIDQLKHLLAACDDNAGHHVIWVTNDGTVQISLLEGTGPIGFEADTHSMKMRLETVQQGNGYVGPVAANDDKWVNRLFDGLNSHWKDRHTRKGVIYGDYF